MKLNFWWIFIAEFAPSTAYPVGTQHPPPQQLSSGYQQTLVPFQPFQQGIHDDKKQVHTHYTWLYKATLSTYQGTLEHISYCSLVALVSERERVPHHLDVITRSKPLNWWLYFVCIAVEYSSDDDSLLGTKVGNTSCSQIASSLYLQWCHSELWKAKGNTVITRHYAPLFAD